MKLAAKYLLKYTPFYPIHIGNYMRERYFWKCFAQLPVESFTKVLDAGCGCGQYALRIAHAYPWIEVIALDIVAQEFRVRLPTNFHFRKDNILNLDDNCIYNFIYCIDVLEHIQNNTEVLKCFYCALKDEGYLYIHMPYDIEGKHIFPKKFFSEFNAWSEKEHKGKQYKLNEMTSILQGIGFEVLVAEYTMGFLGNLSWELDRISDGKVKLKILLMPFLKVLGQISVRFRHRYGNVQVLARKLT